MARAVEYADEQLGKLGTLGLGEVAQVVFDRFIKIDDVVRQVTADRDLVHVDIGRVEEAAFFRHGDHGQGVGAAGRGDGGAFQRTERDIDLGTAGADLLTDVE